MTTLNCSYKDKCGGCPSGDQTLADQLAAKLSAMRGFFPDSEIVYTPTDRVRDRVDLIWQEGRLGLFARETRRVLDLAACPMMSEALEAWFKLFRQRAPLIQKGSVRLRVSPAGLRGVWLDFANQDVKTLFTEKSYLEWLSQNAFVEIGQRRKALTWRDGEPKLVDPILKPWFETYGPDGEAIPLYGPVGGFSQAGFAANRALVAVVTDLAARSGVKAWLELFSGNGNFALALAARAYAVEAVELDPLAVAGFELSAKGLAQPPRVLRGDVYLKTKSLPELSGRGLLVDPPRAGLRELLPQLAAGTQPAALLYVSCFEQSFLSDAEKLKDLGYKVRALRGVDQFPFSPHCEWVGLFEKALEK